MCPLPSSPLKQLAFGVGGLRSEYVLRIRQVTRKRLTFRPDPHPSADLCSCCGERFPLERMRHARFEGTFIGICPTCFDYAKEYEKSPISGMMTISLSQVRSNAVDHNFDDDLPG